MHEDINEFYKVPKNEELKLRFITECNLIMGQKLLLIV